MAKQAKAVEKYFPRQESKSVVIKDSLENGSQIVLILKAEKEWKEDDLILATCTTEIWPYLDIVWNNNNDV